MKRIKMQSLKISHHFFFASQPSDLRKKTQILALMWTLAIQYECCSCCYDKQFVSEIPCIIRVIRLNSLAPGGFDYSLKLTNFKLISTLNILSIFCEIAVRWMPQHPTDH